VLGLLFGRVIFMFDGCVLFGVDSERKFVLLDVYGFGYEYYKNMPEDVIRYFVGFTTWMHGVRLHV